MCEYAHPKPGDRMSNYGDYEECRCCKDGDDILKNCCLMIMA